MFFQEAFLDRDMISPNESHIRCVYHVVNDTESLREWLLQKKNLVYSKVHGANEKFTNSEDSVWKRNGEFKNEFKVFS